MSNQREELYWTMYKVWTKSKAYFSRVSIKMYYLFIVTFILSTKFLYTFSTQQPHKRTTPLIQTLQDIPDKPDPDPEPEPRKEKGNGSTRSRKYSM